MPPGLWFVLGAMSASVLALASSSARRRRLDREASLQLRTLRAELDLAKRSVDHLGGDLERVSQAIGRDLAAIASATEGHADLLAERLVDADPETGRAFAARAGRLLNTIRRLRLLSEKLITFAGVESLTPRPIDLRATLTSVARDLNDFAPHLTVALRTADQLPLAMARDGAIRRVTLFLVETLIEVEPRATRLTLRAGGDPQAEDEHRVVVEVCAEVENDDEVVPDEESSGERLGFVAARNLLEALGATLSFDAVEGLSATCVYSLPVAPSGSLEPIVELSRPVDHGEAVGRWSPDSTENRHEFGGVLILENDPDIRELIAHEIGPSGRAIVTCVDGAAARSLIEATPERFELAILQADAQVESGLQIVETIHAHSPSTRLLLLGRGRNGELDEAEDTLGAVRLEKPFGIQDLRRALHRAIESQPTGVSARTH